MTLQSLRSTQSQDGGWQDRLSSLAHDRVSLLDIEEHSVDSFVENYPYPGQTILTGDLRYQEEFGDIQQGHRRTVSGEFEFRTESQMFILKMDTDMPSPNTIIRDLNSALSEQIQIYRNLFATPRNLWDFINQAEEILEITVLIDGHELPYDEIEDTPVEDVIGNHPIETARVIFTFNGESVHLKYANGSISIRNSDAEADEYVIQLFERYVLEP
jgi:hypothetical protein